MVEPDRTQGGASSFEWMIKPEFGSDHPPKDDNHPKEGRHPKAGEICPHCRSAKLDYDGLLNLSCPSCGYVLAGCFT